MTLDDAAEELLKAYVAGIIKANGTLVKSDPDLLSMLYDIDLLPEQLLHVLRVNPQAAGPNAARFAVICALWKARDLDRWQALIGKGNPPDDD